MKILVALLENRKDIILNLFVPVRFEKIIGIVSVLAYLDEISFSEPANGSF